MNLFGNPSCQKFSRKSDKKSSEILPRPSGNTVSGGRQRCVYHRAGRRRPHPLPGSPLLNPCRRLPCSPFLVCACPGGVAGAGSEGGGPEGVCVAGVSQLCLALTLPAALPRPRPCPGCRISAPRVCPAGECQGVPGPVTGEARAPTVAPVHVKTCF